ncbi:hypothetical protein MiSe_82300 [Microseira wollei NIES-4236]|uniref:Uncharacterized protein n=1 Tax=Microseira wollei NIES-4236 TaxID=2530354 RepID=A0AAV3XTJ5_9CYAN|nr:hypothetical protein MiSe_82300 [Microseira wollei NIES-4236]
MQTTFMKILAQPNQHLKNDGEDVIQGLTKMMFLHGKIGILLCILSYLIATK